MSTGNRGVALMWLADGSATRRLREPPSSRSRLRWRTMWEGWAFAAYFEEQLPKARALLDRLAGP